MGRIAYADFVFIVVLLFYVHSKQLRSGRSVNLTSLFLGRLRPPKLRAYTFESMCMNDWLTA